MSRVRQYRHWPTETPQWLIDARIRAGKPAYPHLDMSQPCKNGQPHVASDGSCLRCGTDQGVACPVDRALGKEQP